MAKSKKSREKGRHKLKKETIVDKRFKEWRRLFYLKNKEAGIGPDNDNALSEALGKDRGYIGNINRGEGHVSHFLIAQLGLLFNADANYFFNPKIPFRYVPKVDKEQKNPSFNKSGMVNTGSGKIKTEGSVVSTGDKTKNFHLNGGTQAATNDYQEDKMVGYFQQADHIINNNFNGNEKKLAQEIVNSIKLETEKMKGIVHDQTEELKKISKDYETDMKAKDQKIRGLETKISEMQESQQKLLDKYLKLSDEKEN